MYHTGVEQGDTADRDGIFRTSCMIRVDSSMRSNKMIRIVAGVENSTGDSARFDPSQKERH